jgi:ferrous iron transport protein B
MFAFANPLPRAAPRARVVLAGNPNCGKTSIFNALTGSHQHVANYAGVTVEKRTGSFDAGGFQTEVVDLPGTYSLSSCSPEERVAEFEISSEPDVVVVVADSTQLDRSLVLLAQIMQTGCSPVLCLNMADEAHAAGQTIDVEQMERLLGFPVVETVGHRGHGIARLRAAIARAARSPVSIHKLVLGEDLDRAIASIRARLPEAAAASNGNWTAVRLLVGDGTHTDRVAAMEGGRAAVDEAIRQRTEIERATGRDAAVFVAERFFGFVGGLLREVRTVAPRIHARQITDRIDDVFVNRYLGLPIFAVVMLGIFWLAFAAGEHPMAWIAAATSWIGEQTSSLWPDGSQSPLRSLLVDGVIGGVGGVIVFLPNIVLLFLGLAFLEDTGYMARAAFLSDRVMHRFGLHGKSFIPMLSGFGCSVPGIMATRILENERDRLTTMIVLPLMSCGARLPIWMLLIPAFFPPALRAPMLWLVYATGIALALGLALVLRRTLLRGDDAPFVMELPPYRLPTPRSVVAKMARRSWSYLRKAGTTILGISILLWAATTYPKPTSYRIDAQIASGAIAPVLTPAELAARRAAEALEHSVAGRVGHALQPVFAPLGFDWKIVTAMIGSFAAKEVFVSQMGIVYSIGDAHTAKDSLRQRLARNYSPLTALSVMLFLLVASPCMATVVVTKKESGRWRWAMLQLGGLTAIGYVLSLIVYQIGHLFV